MAGNTFGQIFRLTTFGESHGLAIGGVIDGCPSGFELDLSKIQAALDRRKPGQSAITTQRKESDTVQFLSGLFEGRTTGSPIGFIIPNEDQKSKDYDHLKEVFRPSHADFTYQEKYGLRDHRGGGRSSARETACRVVAGAIAQQFLEHIGIGIHAFVSQVGTEVMPESSEWLPEAIDSNPVRCPHPESASRMEALIREVRKAGDTIGGVVSCKVVGVPTGWGEPVFNKLHADLGKAMLSINAAKGFDYGSGFSSVTMRGSEHNDAFGVEEEKVVAKTNRSGGIQGGISNGQDIRFRVAFKPVATLMQDQATVNTEGQSVELKGKGRHDPCVVPRAVPIVDAMTALVLLDHCLLDKTVNWNG